MVCEGGMAINVSKLCYGGGVACGHKAHYIVTNLHM